MKIITLLIIALALQANTADLPLKVVYASNDCPNENASTSEITTAALEAIIAHHNKLNFPKIGVPKVDFDQSMLINIALGKQSQDAVKIQPTAATLVANLNADIITLPLKLPPLTNLPLNHKLSIARA